MIRVIGGVVSFNGKLLKKGAEFSSTKEHEKRLVDQKFAEYINELGNGEEPKQPEQPKEPQKAEEFNEEKALKLKVEELKALANTFGISEEEMVLEDGKNKTKKEIIELIKGSIASAEEDEGDAGFNELGNGEEGIA